MIRVLQRKYLIEWLVALVAFGVQALLLLAPAQPRLQQEHLGDFKLVYAAAAALAHTGGDYKIPVIAEIHRQNGVVVPFTWYGHGPSYPPFTLLALFPLLLLPMVPAAFLWAGLSYAALAAASARLASFAAERFGVPRWMRIVLICLIAASPLVSFGLELANLSVVAACLCTYAATAAPERGMWLPAAALAAALILKPHLALWAVLAMALLPRRSPLGSERGIALRSVALFWVALVPMAVYLGATHQLLQVPKDYLGILRTEAASGCMNVHNREIMMIPAHVPSLGSLLGYWPLSPGGLFAVELAILVALFLWLTYLTLSMDPDLNSLLICAWIAFGLVATYHRAHDGVALFLMLPWVFGRLCRRWNDASPWTLLLLYAVFSIDVPPAFYVWVARYAPLRDTAFFLMFRQVALASILLVFAIALVLTRARDERSVSTSKRGRERVLAEPSLT